MRSCSSKKKNVTAIGCHDYNNVRSKKKQEGIERLRKNISGSINDVDQVLMLLLTSVFSCIYMHNRSFVFSEVTFVLLSLEKRKKIQR